jgi:hypothetical protein
MTYLTAMHVPLVKVRIARREHDFTKYLDTAIYDSDIYINQCNQYILSLSVRVDSWPWGGVQLYVMNAVKSGLLHGGTPFYPLLNNCTAIMTTMKVYRSQ